MINSLAAINAIRHVIQEHADSDDRLGKPGNIDGIQWFGKLLGWTWPPSYLEVLAKHDGVTVGNACVLSFLESIEIFMLHPQEWHRVDGYWPIASDGCGNYSVLAIGKKSETGECPVEFIDAMQGYDSGSTVAESYADFVYQMMKEECENSECSFLKKV